MNKNTSLYLDFIRILAALTVMIGHLSGKRFMDGFLWQFGLLMDDAVVVFFVLSGFVIAYASSTSQNTPRRYIEARLARLYSVALPALLLTTLLDALGQSLAPELYNASWNYKALTPASFMQGLFFINQIWFNLNELGSLLPYWSLGYEVWYYVLFGVVCFARKYRWPIFLFVCAVIGPKILLLAPIWCMGLLAYHFACRRTLSDALGSSALLLSCIGLVIHYLWLKPWVVSHGILPEVLGVDHFLERYLIAVLFTLHLVGFVWLSRYLPTLSLAWEKAIRWVAGGTFTLYLMHLPIAQCLIAMSPWSPQRWQQRLLVLLGTLLLIYLLAEITERKKHWISQGLRRYFPPKKAL